MILSFIVILKCHDNRNRGEIFNIVISPTRYYRKYRDYRKIHCSETFISVKYFQLISTILVPVALLSDIVIISIIVIITLMIYRDMKFLLSPIPRVCICVCLRMSVFVCIMHSHDAHGNRLMSHVCTHVLDIHFHVIDLSCTHRLYNYKYFQKHVE